MPELFEAQAATTPEAVALVCGGEELTYAELNARANGLALRLVEAGVGTETPVAVLLERAPTPEPASPSPTATTPPWPDSPPSRSATRPPTTSKGAWTAPSWRT
ncbi:AMP-binding protein [Kitasatospora aureofaciens]|uniref:AMP-binding protein n=1 Tax=Kitasatospora aureofaciens TaxID=1894 RepID=UPI003B9726FE